MTKKEALAKVEMMITCNDGLVDFLRHETKRLLNSGGVDPEDYENNYRLPKILLTVALENATGLYKSHDVDIMKVVRNLRSF